MNKYKIKYYLNEIYKYDTNDHVFDIKFDIYQNSAKGYVHFDKNCMNLGKENKRRNISAEILKNTSTCKNCYHELANINNRLYNFLEVLSLEGDERFKLGENKNFVKNNAEDNYNWLIRKYNYISKLSNFGLGKEYINKLKLDLRKTEIAMIKYYRKKYKDISKIARLQILYNNVNEVKMKIFDDEGKDRRIKKDIYEKYRENKSLKEIKMDISMKYSIKSIEDLTGNMNISKKKNEPIKEYIERYYNTHLLVSLKKILNSYKKIVNDIEDIEEYYYYVEKNKEVNGENYKTLLLFLSEIIIEKDDLKLYKVRKIVCEALSGGIIAKNTAIIDKSLKDSIDLLNNSLNIYEHNGLGVYSDLKEAINTTYKIFL